MLFIKQPFGFFFDCLHDFENVGLLCGAGGCQQALEETLGGVAGRNFLFNALFSVFLGHVVLQHVFGCLPLDAQLLVVDCLFSLLHLIQC